jgi:mRNA-degrading endonuclease toxin of MazEF toxin-antitoxin module
MRPGDIYNLYIRFKHPAQGGKVRPALVMSVQQGQALVVVVKITGSKPTRHFPNRIPLLNWRSHSTGLIKPSYAEIDTLTVINPYTTASTYRGLLHPTDFNRVLIAFRRFHNV